MRATRWVLLSVMVASGLLIAAQATASDARLESMALQREYVEDYFNFRTFPTVAARFSNLATVALGSVDSDGDFGNDRSVGVIGAGDNTSYGVFAIYLNQVQTDAVTPTGDPVDDAQFDITWAKQFSSVAIGIGLLYQNSSQETEPNTFSPLDGFSNDLDDFNTNLTALTGGVKFGAGEGSSVELAGQLGWYSWADSSGVDSEDAGNVSYVLSGRMMKELGDKTTLVPLLRYSKFDLTEDPGVGAEEEMSRTQFNAGVALNYEVNGSDLLVLGISADYMKDVDEGAASEISDWSIPTLFLATEFDVYSWLTLRAGARKTFDNVTDKDTSPTPAPDTDVKASSYTFGLGLGLHFDHFDVDATLNPDWVFSGGYFLSGQSTEQPLGRVTATYYF